MSSEATIRNSLQVAKGNISYQSGPTGYQADVSGNKGPCVGTITVSPAGTDVSLTQITVPGLCYIQNLDPTNWVQYGIREPATGRFFPLCQLLPGEGHVIRLSPFLGEQYDNTGTGTSAAINKLHVKANGGACNVRIDLFEA